MSSFHVSVFPQYGHWLRPVAIPDFRSFVRVMTTEEKLQNSVPKRKSVERKKAECMGWGGEWGMRVPRSDVRKVGSETGDRD